MSAQTKRLGCNNHWTVRRVSVIECSSIENTFKTEQSISNSKPLTIGNKSCVSLSLLLFVCFFMQHVQQSPTYGRSVLLAEWMVCTKLAATLESISPQTECVSMAAAKLFDMCLDGCAAKRFDVIFCCSSLWGSQCRLLTFLLALKMIPLNALRPDVVPDASFTFMVWGPCIIDDLRGNTGRPWSKGLFTAVSAEGQTALVTAKFFGDGAAQKIMHSEFLSKFKPKSIWVVNEGKPKKCGFKGNPRNSKWSCASAPIDLELAASTVLTPTTTVEIKRSPCA